MITDERWGGESERASRPGTASRAPAVPEIQRLCADGVRRPLGDRRGFTNNVSLSGVLIGPASLPAPIGANPRLRFSFFLGSFATVFRGKVVRHAEEGFAIQFASLEEAQLKILRTALPPGVDA